MSVWDDMARDGGYRGDEAREVALRLEQQEREATLQPQPPEDWDALLEHYEQRAEKAERERDQLYAAIKNHRAAVTAAGDVHVDSLDIPKAQAKRMADARLWRVIDERTA